MIDLLQLGTGSMQPLPDRWLSSFVIRNGNELALFDCGEGTQIIARHFSWGFKRISAICISHHHADHIAGLPGILMCIANAGRTETVTVYGPRDTVRIVEALLTICPGFPFDLKIVELEDGAKVPLIGDLRATVLEVAQRTMPVLAWRFDLTRHRRFDRAAAERDRVPQALWSTLQDGNDVASGDQFYLSEWYLGPPRPGLAFGIVTDTRPSARLAEFMHDVDLLISEATYLDDADREKALLVDHFLLSEACDLANAANADRLLLTHFSASYPNPEAYESAAQARFPNAEIGYSGWETTLSFREE